MYSPEILHDCIRSVITPKCKLCTLSSKQAIEFADNVYYELERELLDGQKVTLIRHVDAHIFEIAVKKLDIDFKDVRKQKKIFSAYNTWMDQFEAITHRYIENIISQHKDIINNYVAKFPTAFSVENKELWNFLSANEIRNYRKIGDMMNLSPNEFNLAKHRLIKSCMEIYKGTQNFTTYS
jgi:hypothetical protein